MLVPEEKEIDGRRFSYTPLMVKPARKLFNELVKRFGPSVGGAISSIQSDITDVKEDTSDGDLVKAIAGALGTGVTGLSQALDPTFHEQLVVDLGRNTMVEESEGMVPLTADQREKIFGGKMATELKWIAFCLGVQFSDFLDLLKEGVQVATTALKKDTSSLNSPKK